MRCIAILMLACGLTAQASFTTFGQGCPFENQIPTIGNTGLPQIGQSFSIDYTGSNYTYNSSQQFAQPYLALGFQSVVTVIPAGILIYQPAGCTGYLQPIALTPMPQHPTLPRYETSFQMTIPNDSGLAGVSFLAQWLLLHTQCGFAGCGFSGAITSNAATVTIGP